MLKFADLSVDMKSFENSMKAYTKLFPNSYLPLLIMYLSREGLLKEVSDLDENDPRIILNVTTEELSGFMAHSTVNVKKKELNKEENEQLNEYIKREGLDHYVLSAFINLFTYNQNAKSISYIVDSDKDDEIIKIKDIILMNESEQDEKAARWFFISMIKTRTEIYHDKTKENDPEIGLDFCRGEWTQDFDSTLGELQGHAGNKVWIQPTELTRLILTKYHSGSIYNPFAGVASYAVGLHKHCGDSSYYPDNGIGNYYYAEEIDELTWAVGKLRLLVYYSDSENYNVGDSSQWRGGSANNVISTPPFGYKILNEDGKMEYADHFVIRRGMETVADEGLVACVVPSSFLWRKDTIDIRRTMIDNQWLEAIAFLPVNLFTYSRTSAAIIFIRKKKHDHVVFADGTTSAYQNGKVNVLDDELVANLLLEREYDPRCPYYDSGCRMEDDLPLSLYKRLRSEKSFDFIKEQDYDLSPAEIFSSIITETEGFKLIRIRDIVSGTAEPAKESGMAKIIKPGTLSYDVFNPILSEELEEGEYDSSFSVINQDALLISPMGNLRPTLFVHSGNDAVVRKDRMYAVYIDASKILPEYLLLELSKDYVSDQLRHRYKGDAISRLSLYDFLSVYIQVPENRNTALQSEKEIFDERRTLHFAKLEKELSALKDKQHADYVKMLRQRKHRIQQVMNEFGPAFSLLNKYRKEHGGVLRDNDIVATRTGETVENYFDKLDMVISKVEDLITCLVDKDSWGNTNSVDIDSYIDNIPSHHLSARFDIQTLHNRDISIEEEGEEADLNEARNVLINVNDLATIFDNIIANAAKWGFTDDVRKDYRVRIEVADAILDNQQAIQIAVSNNGNPIHPSVDRTRFFEWGYGTGTGIGTSQLKDIVEHYGGTITLREYPDEPAGFCTSYEIVLPLISNE